MSARAVGNDKCILVDITPADGKIELDEHQGDALGPIRHSDPVLPLSPRCVTGEQIDMSFVEGCLSRCTSLHPHTCALGVVLFFATSSSST